MKTDKVNPHITKILAIQAKIKNEGASKIAKYLAEHKLIALRSECHNLSACYMQSFDFDCERFLNYYMFKNNHDAGRTLFNSSDIGYYYDVMTKEELKDFKKKTWPEAIEAAKKELSGYEIQKKLDKLHKKEDEIKREIRELESQLRPSA